jgi:hypothetical protein
MPAYPTAQPAALYPGTQIPLVNNAATDSGITTTEQFSLNPLGDGGGCTVMILNTTNQQAVGQFAPTDASANYMPLSGCIVPAGSALAYNLSAGWLRFTFAVAPTSGSLIVSR